ncbi:hypothetical protein [Streptomyces sp. NPDC101455]|uniref:hypothetical protein n=1 Tax=Streptomyces sp. NPDC101455 TaxID=3366142 RepID=UPI003830A227
MQGEGLARLLVGDRDEGVFLFLVPLSNPRGTLPGVTVTVLPDRIGSPVDHCVTSFEHVRLPRTALLQGEHGRLTEEGTFTSAVGSPRKRFLHAIRRVTAGQAVHEREHPGRQPCGAGDRGALRAPAAHLGSGGHRAGPAGRAPQPPCPPSRHTACATVTSTATAL